MAEVEDEAREAEGVMSVLVVIRPKRGSWRRLRRGRRARLEAIVGECWGQKRMKTRMEVLFSESM